MTQKSCWQPEEMVPEKREKLKWEKGSLKSDLEEGAASPCMWEGRCLQKEAVSGIGGESENRHWWNKRQKEKWMEVVADDI